MCEFGKRECRDKGGILVFGGTIEGRRVSDYLVSQKIPHIVCVATEYGEEVLTPQDYLTVHKGRMDMEEMCRFFREKDFMAVVDATHPYAVEVSKNIRAACEREKMKYLRYLRAGSGNDTPLGICGDDLSGGRAETETMPEKNFADLGTDLSDGRDESARRDSADAEKDQLNVWVNSAREAARYLEKQDGVIFLTTGSKELSVFTEEISRKSRLFARVLPSAEVIASCRALGLEGKQICGMQGPFSREMNEAMLLQTKAAWLVTKNTGSSGGFSEKIQAAEACGVRCVIIRRPEETGYGWEGLMKQLSGIIGAENRSEEAAGNKNRMEHFLKEASETENEMENMPGKAAGTRNTDRQGRMGRNDGNQVFSAKSSVDSAAEKRRISCIGIGMGSLDTLTYEAAEEILAAEVIFGAKRILAGAKEMWNALRRTQDEKLSWQETAVQSGSGAFAPRTEEGQTADSLFSAPEKDAEAMRQTGKNETAPVWVQEYEGQKIAAYLAEHPEYRRAAILMSGDVGFYSGAKGIAAAFPDEEVRYFCGISSIVYFASKIPTTWQDAKLLSAHGKKINLLNFVNRYPKIIMLVSGAKNVEQICAELTEADLENIRVTVGTNLSYPEETVTTGTPADFLRCDTTGLHIMMIENPNASCIVSPGVPDEAFVRGKVPMTKEEVRILSIAKLRLSQDAVVYDVGAGTGSVAVECARLCTVGTVYAIEKNPEGIALIRENSRKLQVSNVVPVEGSAPQAMEDLPAPTHAFIGGSSGNMRDILEMLRKKNPNVRIVINTIALESISEVMKLLPEVGAENADIVQACIAKSRVLGRYHMMGALNPVYIISFGGTE